MRETIVLTFWDNREDMENYYSKDGSVNLRYIHLFHSIH